MMSASQCKQSLLSIDALRKVHEKKLEDGKSPESDTVKVTKDSDRKSEVQQLKAKL